MMSSAKYWLLIFWIAHHVSLSMESDCIKSLNYQFTLKGKSFVNHTFKIAPCKQEIECPLYCHQTGRCVSYSFDEQLLVCNLSDSDHTMHPEDLVNTPHAIYRSIKHNCNCTSNSKRCKLRDITGKHKCDCKFGFVGQYCQKKADIFQSCKDALSRTRSAKNGMYYIQTNTTVTKVYCYMENITGCGGGGWTTIMKTDGNKATFRYDSNFWTNKSSYVIVHGQSDYDGAKKTKLPTYWTMPLQSLCLGMKTKLHSKPKWILLQNMSSTLYSMIADDKYRKFAVGRSQWKSLLSGSSLQYGCNQEGFNSLTDSDKFAKVRIGIIANDNNHCTMTDSLIGFGAHGNDCNVTTGNCGWINADNGDKKIAAYGIILGR